MKESREYLNKYKQHQGCLTEEDKMFISVSDAKKAMIEMTKDYLQEAHDIALESKTKFDIVEITVLKSNIK